jgi:hypothetical protein
MSTALATAVLSVAIVVIVTDMIALAGLMIARWREQQR